VEATVVRPETVAEAIAATSRPKLAAGMLCGTRASVSAMPGHRHAGPSRVNRLRMMAMGGAEAWFEQNAGGVASISGIARSDWASCSRVETKDGRRFFVKRSNRPSEAMLAGEAASLQAIGASGTVMTPRVHDLGDDNYGSFLVCNWLELSNSPAPAALGDALGRLHAAEPLAPEARAGLFGFPVDNTIGATPQPNPWTDEDGTEAWSRFFADHRLRAMAARLPASRLTEDVETLAAALCRPGAPALFSGTFAPALPIRPTILHGDLWSGNVSSVAGSGDPVILDPASYYGHHEAEWGMSWCMRGLTADFWTAYRCHIPKDPGFEERRALYEASWSSSMRAGEGEHP